MIYDLQSKRSPYETDHSGGVFQNRKARQCLREGPAVCFFFTPVVLQAVENVWFFLESWDVIGSYWIILDMDAVWYSMLWYVWSCSTLFMSICLVLDDTQKTEPLLLRRCQVYSYKMEWKDAPVDIYHFSWTPSRHNLLAWWSDGFDCSWSGMHSYGICKYVPYRQSHKYKSIVYGIYVQSAVELLGFVLSSGYLGGPILSTIVSTTGRREIRHPVAK